MKILKILDNPNEIHNLSGRIYLSDNDRSNRGYYFFCGPETDKGFLSDRFYICNYLKTINVPAKVIWGTAENTHELIGNKKKFEEVKKIILDSLNSIGIECVIG